ncbi:hypothetical protein ACT3TS_01305 [Specibacter sp. AOP5-B1-6]|uniref:hypothetical protein n=1 Tax=Specibacter sp. AOP5-B1-6 TaxID=3457653 RepID=UPI00402B807C
MLGINWMELLVLVGTIGVGAAVVVYLALRMFVWSKAESKSLEHIRKHALWTGIIAWAFSSLTGASRAGLYSPQPSAAPFDPAVVHPVDPWSTIPFPWLIVPVVAVILVHLVGQLSWPAPKSAKRVAVLEFRQVRDYVQPALGWTVLGIFLLAGGALTWLSFAPAFPSRTSGQTSQGLFPLPLDGRIPGWMLATALGASLTILAAGTMLVMRLIASRRSLEALSPEQNTTLRIIGMNRLLRVSATVASGLAAIAGNYLAQPAPDSPATSWVNWLGIVNMAVLIAMLFWKPPFLDSATDDPGYNTLHVPGASSALASDDGPAAAKLTNSAGAAVLPAAIVGAAVGYAMHGLFGLTGIVAVATLFVLLAHLAMEFLLRRNYGTPGAPRSKLRVFLPRPMYFAFAVATIGMVLALMNAHRVAASGSQNSWDGLDAPAAMYWIPGIAALGVLAVGLAVLRFILTRPGLGNAPSALDRTLRRRSLFRIARTVTGSWFAILGILLIMVPVAPASNPLMLRFESGFFGLLCNVIAVLLVFYPMRAFTPADFTPAGNTTSLSK